LIKIWSLFPIPNEAEYSSELKMIIRSKASI
jgi:hypothetical protein